MKKIKLKVNKYISEGENTKKINDFLICGTKTLLNAPMKVGKTYLASELFKLRKNCINIFITPRNSLGFDVFQRFKDEHDIKMLFEGDKINFDELDKLIITSPESFRKIIELIKPLKEKRKVFIIYDEIHLAVTDFYRKDLYNVINIDEELKEFGIKVTLLGLTATDSHIKALVNFDNSIDIEVKEKFKQTPLISILSVGKKITSEFIASSVINVLENNPSSPITIRINNKKLIKEACEIIESKTKIKPLIGTSDNSNDVLEVIQNKGILNEKISFFTSYTEVGIEFLNNPNMILLDFEGLNNTPINHLSIVQNIGRYRNGLRACIIYINRNSKTLYPNIKEIKKNSQIYISEIIKLSIRTKNPSEYTKQVEDTEEFEQNCDIEFEVTKRTSKIYTNNLINNPKDLKRELKKVKTLNVDKIITGKVNFEKTISILDDIKEELEKKKKASKEEKKSWESELNTLIEEMITEEEFKKFYKENEVFNPKMKRCIELLKFLNKYEELIKNYYSLYKYLGDDISDKKYFELAFFKYDEVSRQIEAIENNKQRAIYKKNNTFVKKSNETKSFFQQNHIMNVIENTTGKEKRFYLSRKLLNRVLEACKYKDIQGTKKNPYKNLIGALNLYYSLTKDKSGFKVVSIKDDLKPFIENLKL